MAKTKRKEEAKYKGCVRAARYQIGDVDGDRIEVMKRWHAVAESCQVAANAMFQAWLVWHIEAGTADKIQQMRIEWVAYKEKEGPKPAIIQPFPSACSKACYDAMTAVAKNMNMNVLTQLMQSEKQKFMSRPATRGKWSYWQQVLLCRERMPQFAHPLPIPIKRSAYDMVPPLNSSSTRDYTIVSRIDRIEPAEGRKVGTSHEDRFTLFARKKNIANYRAILQRIETGEYKRMGGSLSWDDRKKRWFFSVMYKLPKESAELDGNKVAVLRPAADHPWELDLGGDRPLWIGGDGLHVTSVRRNLHMQRQSRQSNYRHASSANKGHGRDRALQPLFKLSRRWKDFVKTANNTTTYKVAQILLDRGYGAVVFEQPEGAQRDECFLGKTNLKRCSMGWDWYQVATQLRQKCERHGIKVTISKQKKEPLAKCDISADTVST